MNEHDKIFSYECYEKDKLFLCIRGGWYLKLYSLNNFLSGKKMEWGCDISCPKCKQLSGCGILAPQNETMQCGHPTPEGRKRKEIIKGIERLIFLNRIYFLSEDPVECFNDQMRNIGFGNELGNTKEE